MFDLPPQAGPARDAAILSHIEAGDFEVSWAQVQSGPAVFNVFADALKIGGVRISCSATVLQKIADLLGCMLLTPKISDLCFLQARQVPPLPISPNSTDTATMIRESQLLDQHAGGFISPVGKPWVLSNKITPTRAALYGWQSNAPIGNIPLYAGVTPGVRVIQPLSTAHDPSYTDYAMLCVLMSKTCTLDGQVFDTGALLQGPHASLGSHEGPLHVLRQPGVAPIPQLAPGLEPVSLVTAGAGSNVGAFLLLGAAGFLGGLAAFK